LLWEKIHGPVTIAPVAGKCSSCIQSPGNNPAKKFSRTKKNQKKFPFAFAPALILIPAGALPLAIDPGQGIRRDQEEPPRPVL